MHVLAAQACTPFRPMTEESAMPIFHRTLAALFLAISMTFPAVAADPVPAKGSADPDTLRSVLLESKDKNRGVAIYVNGTTVNAVVVSVDDRYVTGRSQQSSRIVIRLDRIDGVASAF
jgi:hypothetical protein